MTRKDFEMADTSPGTSKGSKIWIVAVIVVLVASGGVYAFNRNTTKTTTATNTQSGTTANNDISNSGIQNSQTQAPAASSAATASTPTPSTPTPNTAPADSNSSATDGAVSQVVHFGFDSAELLPAENAKINDLWSKIKGGKGEIAINGYTDNIGSHQYNITLSQKRAATVESILKQLGATSQFTFTTKGNAEENAIGDNSNSNGRALNRRVEIKFAPTK